MASKEEQAEEGKRLAEIESVSSYVAELAQRGIEVDPDMAQGVMESMQAGELEPLAAKALFQEQVRAAIQQQARGEHIQGTVGQLDEEIKSLRTKGDDEGVQRLLQLKYEVMLDPDYPVDRALANASFAGTQVRQGFEQGVTQALGSLGPRMVALGAGATGQPGPPPGQVVPQGQEPQPQAGVSWGSLEGPQDAKASYLDAILREEDRLAETLPPEQVDQEIERFIQEELGFALDDALVKALQKRRHQYGLNKDGAKVAEEEMRDKGPSTDRETVLKNTIGSLPGEGR